MNTPSPSSTWQPPSPEQLDEWLDRYTVRSLIGRGGMGAVYLAWQSALDRNVAVKLLPAELGTDVSFVKRFEREAKAMARLDHPNIVRVFDFGRTEAGHFYFVMEHVDGCDVSQLIRQGEIPVAEAMDIVTQLCAALGYAHSEGIIHRDIKPSNILLDKKGRVKIADFGLARPATSTPEPGLTRMTESGMVMGTLEYMAPEQLMGKNVDHRADLYAVGVLFYELLTGDVPRGSWRPPSNCRPMDSGLDQVVQRALQPKPEERYQHAHEVQRDVTTVLQRKVPAVRRSWKRSAAILTFATIAGLAVAWKWQQPVVAENSVAPLVAAAPAEKTTISESPAAKPPEAPKEILHPAPSVKPAPSPMIPAVTQKPVVIPPTPTPTAPTAPLPVLPEGSTELLDFSKTPQAESAGAWKADLASVTDGRFTLASQETSSGSLAWELPNGPIDLSVLAEKHLQIEAELTAASSRSILLTLEDQAGRTRSWRLKGESFFQGKPRRHAHRLPLAEAELKSLTSGYGERFDTLGFDLSKVVKLKFESDPAGDAKVPMAWRVHRIFLLP